MTLIVIFPTQDGIIVGSDTQLTQGNTRTQANKIYEFGDGCLWAGAGDVHVIQRVEEELYSLQKKPLKNIRDVVGKRIKKCIEQCISLDIRSNLIDHPDQVLSLFPVEFLFAEHISAAEQTIYLYFHSGQSSVVARPFAIGSGAIFAFALLQKYEEVYDLFDTRAAAVLTYKILGEAIKVGAYGLGLPIDIWVIDSCGSRRIEGTELESVINASLDLKTQEIKLLIPNYCE